MICRRRRWLRRRCVGVGVGRAGVGDGVGGVTDDRSPTAMVAAALEMVSTAALVSASEEPVLATALASVLVTASACALATVSHKSRVIRSHVGCGVTVGAGVGVAAGVRWRWSRRRPTWSRRCRRTWGRRWPRVGAGVGDAAGVPMALVLVWVQQHHNCTTQYQCRCNPNSRRSDHRSRQNSGRRTGP